MRWLPSALRPFALLLPALACLAAGPVLAEEGAPAAKERPGVPEPFLETPDLDQLCPGPCIQVASFDMEALGGTRLRRGQPVAHRTLGQLELLALLLGEELDLEVMALQDVDTTSSSWNRFSRLLGRQGYRYMSGRPGADGLSVVLAWDQDEVTRTSGDLSGHFPADTADPGSIACPADAVAGPVAAAFRAGSFDFVLVGARFVADEEVGSFQDCPDRLRDRQARRLLRGVEAIKKESGEEDVVLAGSFHARSIDAGLRAFQEAGFVSLLAESRRASGSGTYSFFGGDSALLDHILVDPRLTTEAVAGSGLVTRLPWGTWRRWVRWYSDHVPVTAGFSTEEDRD